MDQAHPPTLDPHILEANLSALRQQEPALADRINSVLAEVADATPTVTRDQALNFRIADAQGRVSWFGRTSIPSVRAAALIDRFDAGQGNVLLPEIGQGSEVTLLLRRLGRHRAVFVWEPTETAIALALYLHDWAQALTEQRLILIACQNDQLTTTLADWLADHPGHLCPERIMMWPWSTPPELASCRSSVQIAYQQTEIRRAEAFRAVQVQVASIMSEHKVRPPDEAKRLQPGSLVAFLSQRAHEETWALSDALTLAADTQGWRTLEISIRRPGDVHPLARARRLIARANQTTDAAILLDTTRKEVNDILPKATPAISWLSLHSAIDASLPSRIGPRDRLAVTCSQVRDRAVEAGLDKDRVAVIPHPCLASAESMEESLLTVNRPIDVALIADLVPTSPEYFGHKLPSHTQLWNQALEMLESRIDTFTADRGDSLLAQAEAKLKTRIEDRAIRRAFIESLSTSVANTILSRYLAQSLAKNKVKFRIGGRGWPSVLPGLALVSASTVAQRWKLFQQSKIILHADVTGEVSSTALLAAAAGSVLIARSHPRDSEPGGLATLLEPDREMVRFARITDLMATLKNLLKNAVSIRKMGNRAAERCHAEHLPEHRLIALGRLVF